MRTSTATPALGLLIAALLLAGTVQAAPSGPDHRESDNQGGRHEHYTQGRKNQNQDQRPQSQPSRTPAQTQFRPGHSVAQLPSGYRQIHHRDHDYYYVRGNWYRPQGKLFVVVAPPIGLSIPVLPGGYVTLMVGGHPYYRYNDVYYVQRNDHYVVVEAPSSSVTVTPAQDELFVYPAQNQSAAQQSQDRYECHQWGNSQTGYDPTQPYGGVAADQSKAARANYQRAMTACLEARGYTVR